MAQKIKSPQPRKKSNAGECCNSVLTDVLDMRMARKLANGYAALADPVRLKMLSLIAGSPTGEVCACELAGPLKRSQPTISHHLKILREAGLIESDRRGTWIWYRVVSDQLDVLSGALAKSR